MEDKFLNIKEVSAMVGLSESRIYKMREGDKLYIKSVKLGRSLKFRLSDVQNFIKGNDNDIS